MSKIDARCKMHARCTLDGRTMDARWPRMGAGWMQEGCRRDAGGMQEGCKMDTGWRQRCILAIKKIFKLSVYHKKVDLLKTLLLSLLHSVLFPMPIRLDIQLYKTRLGRARLGCSLIV